MKFILASMIALLVATGAFADTPPPPETEFSPTQASEVTLAQYLWVSRPVVVFADSSADPRFIRQLALLEAEVAELVDRDIVVIVDTDPAAMSEWRTALRPRGFMLVLIDKDGGVKLRKPFPWHVRELTRVIDKTPERQQEVRDRRAAGSSENQ